MNPSRPRQWSFDAVQFDESQLALVVAGVTVAAQPLALQLLACLLQAAPRVVRRDELIDRLWHRSPDAVSRNVLSNAASRLRQSLGEVAGRRIVTVAGIGYRFEGPVRSSATGAGEHTSLQLPPPAREFLMRQWFDALHGRQGFDPRASLCDVLRRSIDQAETELAAAPLALAGLHQHLAEHDLLWADHDSAARHFRRAISLHASAGEGEADDTPLGLHFDLCRTLSQAAAALGDRPALENARNELRDASTAMARRQTLSLPTRLKAALAHWVLAGVDLDWTAAQRACDEAMEISAQLPELPAPRWLSLHRNRGVTLARSGQLAAGISALQSLLVTPVQAMADNDVQLLMTRLNLGQFQWLAGHAAEAAATLESLRDSLAGDAASQTAFGVETEVWLAKAWIDVGRLPEARALLVAAHGQACHLKGGSAELALSALLPLTAVLWQAGERDAALQMLQEGLSPRLDGLAMPGQREAVMALAHWVRLLWETGPDGQARARVLLRHLRPGDLQAAALRPADAADFARWLRSVGLRQAAASTQALPQPRLQAASKRGGAPARRLGG